MYETLQQEAADLRVAGFDPIKFAIEAIRINLACYTYKDETILLEAMERLQKFQEDKPATGDEKNR